MEAANAKEYINKFLFSLQYGTLLHPAKEDYFHFAFVSVHPGNQSWSWFSITFVTG